MVDFLSKKTLLVDVGSYFFEFWTFGSLIGWQCANHVGMILVVQIFFVDYSMLRFLPFGAMLFGTVHVLLSIALPSFLAPNLVFQYYGM